MDTDSVSYLAAFVGAGVLALLAALFATLRERSDRRRHNLDRVSLVSWGLMSVLFSMLAIILFATAAKFYFAPAA
jgi:ABC-type xylose transport system permease subunit